MRKIAVIASLLIVAGVLGSVFTFPSVESSVAAERDVDMTEIANINIRMDNGRVNVFRTDTSQAKIELEGSVSERDKPNFSVETEGDTLIIEVAKERKLFQFITFTGSATLNLYLPPKDYDSLIVDTDNGTFQAEELAVKEIQALTDNGKITLDSITAETVDLNTANGKIVLADVEGKITGKTNNGSISFDTPDLDRSMDLETDNGSITIQTEEEQANAVIDARTDNGRVTVFGDSDWDTVTGDGDHEIKLRTSNGSITIEK
ncbi:DUF4097 family beta strand repeat-containing protein [Lentibacillus sediminis]|uniref:DUF4097 family beta strand repeat-containing protein n=1 Tax=Lentibacillus sediminis TaxID=1940529 RepID=UPI000C1C3DA7|nr:DUF4097 family beta strand repeat-containing protein [Lentibacillus sediminis]